MKNLLIGLMLVLSFSAGASSERVVFDLWDGTFAYNKLKVIENENEYTLISSGQYLEIYERLLDYSQSQDVQRLRELMKKTYIQVELTIKIPKEDMNINEQDKLLYSNAAEMKAVMVANAGGKQIIISDIVIGDYPIVELVDVRMLAKFDEPTIVSSRVLQITLNDFGVTPILLHQTVDQHRL